MRVIFMGTPDFAVSILDALHDSGHELIACVSQPDKPVGRHAELKPTAVKSRAAELGIPCLQPAKASDPGFIAGIREMSPDVIVVAAYGRILKKELLDIPRYGCINVHASLLPRWRGAAPIQWAIIEGDKVTGVTAMLMDEGLDTGAMLMRKRVEIAPDETGGSLFDKLAAAGGEVIKETLKRLEHAGSYCIKAGAAETGADSVPECGAAGESPAGAALVPVPQPAEGATYAPMLRKELGCIDWSMDAGRIERLVRGLDPWPGTFSYSGKKMIKIEKARVLKASAEKLPGTAAAAKPGDAVTGDGHIYICCGSGWLEVLVLRPEGKKSMDAADFLRGNRLERLGGRKTSAV